MKSHNFLFHIFHFTFFILSALSEPGKAPKCGQNLFMQNEPNFQPNHLKLSAVITGFYNDITRVNQKITNPIEPKTNPIFQLFEKFAEPVNIG